MNDADIIWLSTQFKHFGYLKPNQIVNQFPNEKILTFKHLLAQTIGNNFGEVDWLPTTFNLENELPVFIGEFRKLQQEVMRSKLNC